MGITNIHVYAMMPVDLKTIVYFNRHIKTQSIMLSLITNLICRTFDEGNAIIF